jgi:hypothetical protein
MLASASMVRPWAPLALACLPTLCQGQPVGEEFQVNTYSTFWQWNHNKRIVAADPSGNFIVVWTSALQDGHQGGIFGRRYDSGGNSLGGEFQINVYTTGYQHQPSIASDAQGNFVVVWAGAGATDPYGIFGRRLDNEGHPQGAEFQVNATTAVYDLQPPSVAMDGVGNFVVVWDCATGNPYHSCGAYGQRFDAQGMRRGQEFRIGSASSHDPTVASDVGGDFVVVYGEGSHAFGQRYDADGAPQGNRFGFSGFEDDPMVAIDGTGGFVVVWEAVLNERDGDSSGIFGRRFARTGQPLGAEFQVNSYTTGRQNYPSVAWKASGGFVVVWQSDEQDGDEFGVFAQRYDDAGSPQGTEFQVNTYTTYDQRQASVATTGAGRFVVVWESYYQDGGGVGIFGQRYDFGGAQAITVLRPNSEVRWQIGALERIQWTHNLGADATFRIELDRDDDGEFEELIAAAAPVDNPSKGSFAWIVTGPRATAARVRVSWTDDSDVADASDVTFQIRPVGAAAHARPDGGTVAERSS